MEERIAKVEGILEERREQMRDVRDRLNHFQAEKADNWEIRIWFLALIAIMTLLKFIYFQG